jgi:hypothetical protein
MGKPQEALLGPGQALSSSCPWSCEALRAWTKASESRSSSAHWYLRQWLILSTIAGDGGFDLLSLVGSK